MFQDQNRDFEIFFVEEEPQISIKDAIWVSGSQENTLCDGLYIASEKQEYPNVRIYRLWTHDSYPDRLMLMFYDDDRYGYKAQIVQRRYFGREEVFFELYKTDDQDKTIWRRMFSQPSFVQVGMNHSAVPFPKFLSEMQGLAVIAFGSR